MATAIAAHMSTEETTPTPQGDGNFCASYIRISLMETTYTPLGAKIQTKERETR